jgi:ribosomal protein L37AE/L43A
MSKNAEFKNAELTAETIVTCPHCYQQNHLFRYSVHDIYKCSNCRSQLADPFTSPAADPTSNSGKALGRFLGILVVFGTSFLINFSIRLLLQDRPVQNLSSAPAPSAASLPYVPLVTSPSAPSPSVILQNRSLPASKVLVAPAPSGDGTLKVSNGTPRDAYVKLVAPDSRKLVTAFYVKADSAFTVEQIPDGTYELFFVTGEDWDAKAKSFSRSSSFTKFDKSLDFVTRQISDGIQYTILELTLNPVTGGNVPLTGVDEQEFGQY